MKKYIITIVDLRFQNPPKTVVLRDNNFEYCVQAVLGGWDNLNIVYSDENGDKIGFVKNRPEKFSILCYTPQN